jgi:hypothetical protein
MLTSLFRYRIDHPHRDMTDNVRSFLTNIPSFSHDQLSQLSGCIGKPISSLCSILPLIGYKIAFHRHIVRLLLADELASSPSSNECIFACFSYQFLSCLFVSRSPQLDSDTFRLFLEGLNKWRSYRSQFLDLVFYFLLNSGFDIPLFPWEAQNANALLLIFIDREELGPDFHPLFCRLLRRILSQGWETDRDVNLSIIYMLYEQNRDISKAPDHQGVLDYINKSVIELDRNALNTLAHISCSVRVSSFVTLLDEIPKRLAARVTKEWVLPEFPERKIHNLPFSVKCQNEMISVGSLVVPIPKILSYPEIDLELLIPHKVQLFVTRLKGFFTILSPEARDHFLGILTSIICGPPVIYQLIAVFVSLSSMKVIPMEHKFISNCLCGGLVFKPQCSVYGPMALPQVVNVLRGNVVEMLINTKSELITKFMMKNRQFPFLMAEMFGRLLCFMEAVVQIEGIGILIDIALDTAIALAQFGPCSDARMPCFLFLSEVFSRDGGGGLSTETDFTIHYCKFVNEIHYRPIILQSFAKLFIAVTNSPLLPGMETYLTPLIDAARTDPTLISQFVRACIDIIDNISSVAALFGKHLDLLLARADSGSFETYLEFLKFVAIADPEIQLSASRWVKLTSFITVKHYPVLLNLIAGRQTESAKELLFRRPVFLPLLLFSIGGDRGLTDSFLTCCLDLCEYSEVNATALHCGDVDSMILVALANRGKSRYFLTEFPLRFSQPLALRLLDLIARTFGEIRAAISGIAVESIGF